MPVAFVIGAGRSGTTVLGSAFSSHPDILYLYEASHRWRSVEPRTDLTQFYGNGTTPSGFLSRDDVSEKTHRLFAALFRHRISGPFTSLLEANERIANFGLPKSWLARARARPKLVLEKTPINALRLGFLNELAPTARFVHIVRDGVEVANSIARLAERNEYQVAGRRQFNQWWGRDEIKWNVLAREGIDAGHALEAEVAMLTSHQQRGAYEWLLTALEVLNWTGGRLSEQIAEVTLPELISDPKGKLAALCAHLGLDAPLNWLDRASALFVQQAASGPGTVELPLAMANAFNSVQAQYGFEGRAVPIT